MNKSLFVLLVALLTQFAFAVGVSLNVQQPINANDELSVTSTKEFNKFNEFFICGNVFHEVMIDNKIISPPKKSQDVEYYLQQITNTLLYSNKETVKFKYGNILEVVLNLPYLGTGNHAYVFEILDKKNEPTNKIFKLNVKQLSRSLKAGMRECYNYMFWESQTANYSFSVTKVYFYEIFGLFCIKQKNHGVSLTKVLIDKQLIFFIDKINNITGYKPVTNEEIKDLNIEKICTAIFDLLSVMKNNPSNCSSISPNNIFVEFAKDSYSIKKVELIDYGISVNKMNRYNRIENFNQYLEIATERMAKYFRLGYQI